MYQLRSQKIRTRVHNADQNTQRFIPISEYGEAITSLTVSADRNILAVAEKMALDRFGGRPTIQIYDAHSFRKRRSVTINTEILAREFTDLSFSGDSRYLVAQLGAPEWTLNYFGWEKGKLMASLPIFDSTTSGSNGTVIKGLIPGDKKVIRHVCINPNDGTRCSVIGDGFCRVLLYAEGELSPLASTIPPNDYQAQAWISGNRLALATKDAIFITDQSALLTTVYFPIKGTILKSISSSPRGFVAGGSSGLVVAFEPSLDDPHGFRIARKVTFPTDTALSVQTMAVSGSEGNLIVGTSNNQIWKTSLAADELQSEESKFESLSQPFHHGAVLGLDVCCRKPLLVTCGTDKSVRVWNYVKRTCELVKYFPEESYTVALHPSGLYLLVGFGDKLRLMNVLMDDLRLFREFPIRSCRECRFSNGGHIFAAVHGNVIQIYNTWTFDNLYNLKGHNGKIKSLYWTPDDALLVSAGTDGAVYTWNILEMKRENEHILKSCAYTSALCTSNGKTLFTVGSDKILKAITDSIVTMEVEANVVLTQIIVSHSGRMMFAGVPV
ncbi:WD40-repeat-containing domain protein [Polychytrium aggregatum]|uniref:WD40-repeat-containing domain protein n=1 Tax=Polychytrium aggregatum TaxID=110093 RepID=UPI0022FE9978|nr:WD40-repeat-containing domain protein [Polychytrium aggregatum]KAI9204617.1 WD40-repeat-containing domain protein [Polychytrium aggregatum]